MTYTTTSVSYNTYEPQPSGYLTVGKNRLRQFGETVYMNDGQEFEIELFNPKQRPVLVKIKLNGTYISTTGIYLKPGQRIHLDRFIEINKKFLFSTYEVDGQSSAVKQAIANNGLVEIEFYDEYIKPQPVVIPSLTPFTYTNTVNYTDNPNIFFNSSVSDCMSRSVGSNDGTLSLKSMNLFDSDMDSQPKYRSATPKGRLKKESVETGRVEAGGNSNQKFTQVYGDFMTYWSSRMVWKIMPNSQKPVEVQDFKNYCPACGHKIKNSNFKFCPNCGNKL